MINEQVKQSKNDNGTPYDSVFRTMITQCPRLIIPVVNEVFGTDYGMNAVITESPNEFFLTSQDGEQKETITDSYFCINGNPYHLECQSKKDGTMIVRMFEYDVQIGMREGSLVGDTYHVQLPDSGVMYLRSTKHTPDKMRIVIHSPGGELVYDVPNLKIKAYSLDDIFAKKLLFLIPFHIFSFESKLKDMDNNEEKLQWLSELYEEIHAKLEEMTFQEEITEYEAQTIYEMTKNVANHLAKSNQNVKERIGEAMGGQILDYPAKRIYDEGKESTKSENFLTMIKDGVPFIKAKQYSGISDKKAKELMKQHNCSVI